MAKLRLKETLGTNLLISFLIRYPELSSLRYNPESTTLSFTLLLKGEVDAERQKRFVVSLTDYFLACRELDPRFPALGQLTQTVADGVTMLLYEQDIDVVSIPETRLYLQVVKDFYQGLIGEESAFLLRDEEVQMQEEIIEQILGQRDQLREEKPIVAYRDGGRVFVYNK